MKIVDEVLGKDEEESISDVSQIDIFKEESIERLF